MKSGLRSRLVIAWPASRRVSMSRWRSAVGLAHSIWVSLFRITTPSGRAWPAARNRASVTASARSLSSRVRIWPCNCANASSHAPLPIGSDSRRGAFSQLRKAARLRTWYTPIAASPTASKASAHSAPASGQATSAASALAASIPRNPAHAAFKRDLSVSGGTGGSD